MSVETIAERGLLESLEQRQINTDERWVEFVAATEGGVETWSGRRYLRISGVVLKRYKKNPVILDTHNRYEAGAVVGRGEVRVEGRELVVRVYFAETERAETIWQLVKGGFINAVSVGYIPDVKNTIELAEGQVDGEGDSAIKGPAVVIKRWELFEISIVPVPADTDAVRRCFLEGETRALDAQIEATVRRLLGVRNLLVDDTEEEEVTVGKDKVESAAAGHTEERAAAAGGGSGESAAQAVQPLDEELAARRAAARKAEILAITPQGLEHMAQECILQGLDVEKARERLLEALKDSTTPAGTGEPDTQSQAGEESVADVPDEVLVQSLLG